MHKRKIFPGYFIEKPLFQSEKDFRRLLSEQDSCFHLNEVSLRFLEDYIKSSDLNNKEFIRQLSKKYNISAGQRSWEVTKKLIANSYIVETYNIQENFFKSFNKEYYQYKTLKNWKTTKRVGGTNKNLDPYSQLIENMSNDKSNKFSQTPESLLIKYYRSIRNNVVHKSDKNTSKSIDIYLRDIKPKEDYFKNYFKFLPDGILPAPNHPNNISYHDFFLYSRSLKNLVNLIINSANLTVDEIIKFEFNNPKFLNMLKRHNLNSNSSRCKMIESLNTFFKTKYGNIKSEKLDFVNACIKMKEK